MVNVSPEPRRYPFVAWRRLKAAIQWKQGQHVLCVGGTGSGKTTVSGELLPRRKLVAVCVSKGMDDIFQGPYFREYNRVTKWPPKNDMERVLLWPENSKSILQTRLAKQAIFRKMFDDVLLHRGYWCLSIDEQHYMCESLKLDREVTDMLEQGRSAFVSMWNNTQRPAGVPLATYANSSHGFYFRSQEEYDTKRLAKLTNKHTFTKEVIANIEGLDDHEFIYIDRSGKIPPVRSIVDVRK